MTERMRWGFLHHLVHMLVDNVHIAAALQSQALFPQFQKKTIFSVSFPYSSRIVLRSFSLMSPLCLPFKSGNDTETKTATTEGERRFDEENPRSRHSSLSLGIAPVRQCSCRAYQEKEPRTFRTWLFSVLFSPYFVVPTTMETLFFPFSENGCAVSPLASTVILLASTPYLETIKSFRFFARCCE